jgi:nucleoside-diphosphate-sugar epimerase
VLLSQLVNRVRYGQPITLQGDDGMRINPIWAGDVAEAFQRCLGLESSATLNVAGPAEWTLRGIGATIGRVLGIEPRFEVQAGTPPRLVGDVSHLQSVLGWAPGVSLLDGLRVWLQELPARQAA